MSENETYRGIETAGLIAPTDADVVVDPVALAHLTSDASLALGDAAPVEAALVQSLEDLLPGADGTVVMLTDDRLPVNLVTNEPLAGCGVVDGQVSAAGLDVGGLYYYSFANGLTLYSDTDVVIVDAAPGA